MPLKGKNALVTGGSRGIGFQICKIFLESGADVLAVSRDSQKLNQAGEQLPGLRTSQADISEPSEHDRVASWVEDNWGYLDILVNNAGVSPRGNDSITDLADEAFDDTFQVNVYGPYLSTKRLLPLLLKSEEPRVINIGSGLGILSSTTSGVYSVTKAAVHALTVATANDLSGRVAVNVLCPGWVKTDMAPDAPGDPRDSAEAALWLVTQPHDVTGRIFQRKVEYVLDG